MSLVSKSHSFLTNTGSLLAFFVGLLVAPGIALGNECKTSIKVHPIFSRLGDADKIELVELQWDKDRIEELSIIESQAKNGKIQNDSEHFSDLGGDNLSSFLSLAEIYSKGSAWLKERGLSQEVETVLYPFSSIDVAPPLLFFPGATLFISIDSSPFSKGHETLRPDLQTKEEGRAFHMGTQSNSIKDVGASILARLALTVPRIRVKSVHLLKLKDVSRRRLMRHHGVINFDQGPGSPDRHYIHLDIHIDSNSSEMDWWAAHLKEIGIDVLMMKAAQGGFHSEGAGRLQNSLLGILEKHNGFILEGDFDMIDLSPLKKSPSIIGFPYFRGYHDTGRVFILGQRAYFYRDEY